MVSPATGSVVLVAFPFSDLSASKLRPAIVLASAERHDWILCQVTLLRQEALWLATGRNGVLGFAGFRKDAPRLAAGSFTINPYADQNAVQISETDFESGSLRRTSFARPGKLFTANTLLMKAEVGRLSPVAFQNVLKAVITIFNG